jgi:hypothetical protein
MSDPVGTGGRGPTGAVTNNPVSDGGTMAKTCHAPNVPEGMEDHSKWAAIDNQSLGEMMEWQWKHRYDPNPPLPTPRAPSKAELDAVMEVVNFIIAQVQLAFPECKGNWYSVLSYALNAVIMLRDGRMWPSTKLGDGSVRDFSAIVDHYCLTPGTPATDFKFAYADHYLNMRADAFNFGPYYEVQLKQAVVNYDKAKVRGLVYRTGPSAVSPATDVSMVWGMLGIVDGLKDDKVYPRFSNLLPREPGSTGMEQVNFAKTEKALEDQEAFKNQFEGVKAVKSIFGDKP